MNAYIIRREIPQLTECACGCGEKFDNSANPNRRYVSQEHAHKSSGHHARTARRAERREAARQVIECACGCGETFDNNGNPNRLYISRAHQHLALKRRGTFARQIKHRERTESLG